MNNKCTFNATNIHLFLKGEYIKRNFEQESKDVEWFLEHWQKPLELLKLGGDDWLKAKFLCDLLLYYDRKLKNMIFPLTFHEYENEIKYIIKNCTDWLEKMYKISHEYKICAPELAIPFDFEKFLFLPDEEQIQFIAIPNFLEDELLYGFMGCAEIEGKEGHIACVVDINDTSYDIKKIISRIENSLVIYRYNTRDGYISEDENKIFLNMPKGEDFKTTYDSSDDTRLFGLLHWDLRLKKYPLQKVRETINQLNFKKCKNKKTCNFKKCDEKDNCKSFLDRALATASLSIAAKEQHATKPSSTAYPYKDKIMKINRYGRYVNEDLCFEAL